MLLYVPEIGDNLLLIRDWQFKLHPERRNLSISSEIGLSEFSDYDRINMKAQQARDFERERRNQWRR